MRLNDIKLFRLPVTATATQPFYLLRRLYFMRLGPFQQVEVGETIQEIVVVSYYGALQFTNTH